MDIEAERSDESIVRLLAAGVVLSVLYIALAYAGRELGQFEDLSVCYPPAGLAFAAGTFFGWRALAPVALVELLGGVLILRIGATFSSVEMLLNAGAYASIYVGAAVALRHLGKIRPHLHHVGNPLPWLFAGVAVAAPAAAVVAVTLQRSAGLALSDGFWSAVTVWWVGHALGVATAGAAFLVVGRVAGLDGPGTGGIPPSLRRDAPASVLTLLVAPALVAAAAFDLWPHGIRFIALVFVPMTLLALRYGGAGAAISGLLMAPIVTTAADRHAGDLLLARTDLQILLLSAVLVSLVVGAVVDDRERTARHDSELGEIVEGMSDLVAVVGRDGRLSYLNPSGRRMLGLTPDEDVAKYGEHDFTLGPDGRGVVDEARRLAAEDGTWSGEIVLRSTDGTDVLGVKRVLAHRDGPGEVVRWATLVRDVTAERHLQRALERAAVEDSLTGIGNRHFMLTQIQTTIDAVAGGRAPAPLILVKLDRISMLMGGLGIELADEMLRQVAQRLAEAAGEGASVARLEGVTFGVHPQVALDEVAATLLGQRIVDAVAVPLEVADRIVPVTCSVGIAMVDGTTSNAEVVRAADVAAQRAQDSGGSRVTRHESTMTEGATNRLALETALGTAIRERTWELHYQPIAQVGTGAVVAVEALLRFPDGLLTFPLVMIAEANGLIVQLGFDILEEACRTAAGWADQGEPLHVHVNVSGRQLSEPGFVEAVARILSATAIDPASVSLELTETAVIDDLEEAREILDGLCQLGVRLALDDFGTGQSSLRVLTSLPFHAVKLDQFLTADVVASARARALVGATVAFARALDLTVVAEGVEGAEQLDVLRDLGCDQMQGYLLSQAIRGDQVRALWTRLRTGSSVDQAL